MARSGLGAGALIALFSAQASAQDAPPGIDTAREEAEDRPDLDIPAPEDDALDVLDAQTPTDVPKDGRQIAFEADNLAYDNENDRVTASGNVVLRSDGQSVRANEVVWNRRSGEIFASGGVRLVDDQGNQVFSDSITLTDAFEAGAMRDLLLVLSQGGRLAANEGLRGPDGSIVLDTAAYSACDVIGAQGCPTTPSWKITADRVIYDPNEKRVRFRGAYFELFGARVLPLPYLSIRTDDGAASGVLLPDLRFSQSNGLEVVGSYYWRIAPDKDVTAGAYLFTEAPPMAYGQWRHLTPTGAYQITGYLTNSRLITDFTGLQDSERDWRGYIFANGRFQLSPKWSVTGSIRRASDRTFLRRYDISREDRLRSMVDLERVGASSYFSLAGWETQSLRLDTEQGRVPVALPVIDYRKRFENAPLGGNIMLQANTLSISRDLGQETQRAFASAQYDLRRYTPMGQVVTFTAIARGDVYHADDTDLTPIVSYRGDEGWGTRGVALAAVDVEWPLVGRFLGGTQVLSPRVQFVATPPISNLDIPNEDARAIDLETSNLFALNRFPGYDRVEDGARVTYGLDWRFSRPGWRAFATVGQSVRFDADREIFPDGTGLSEKVSDFVGRTEVQFRDFVKVTHRYRLDKDNLAVRRNEFDATVGTRQTYAEIGYLRLDRNIDTTLEDLSDREELRFAARALFADHWSVFGSGVLNLTDAEEDPLSGSDGFEPIRTRLGVAYTDDCLELGLTWRRDYITAGDAQRGNTFQLTFSLGNLGFR